MLPKKQYMKLSAAEKAAVKRKLARQLRGKGDYKSAVRGIAGIGATGVGAALGGLPGALVGSLLGQRLGGFLTGKGKYRRAAITGRPQLRGKGEYYRQGAPMSYARAGNTIDMGQQVPEFHAGKQFTEVCHSEYIQDINSTTAFTNTVFPINPGIAATFPWLATIASNYEEYEFKQLIFYYKTTSALALNSTNTALGVVVGATNYNVTQAAFTTKQQMENYEYAKSAPPAVSQIFPVECDRKDNVMNHLYIRSGSLGANQDLRLNDMGNFQLATVGSQATSVVGELWVSYRVCLYKPSLSSVGTSDTISCHYGPTAFPSSVLSTISTSNYFGTTVPSPTSFEVGSNLALIFGSNTITFPASLGQGSFSLVISWTGASTALTNAPNILYTTNCQALKILGNSGSSFFNPPAGTTINRQFVVDFFTITGPSAVITISNSPTLPTSITSADVIVMPINPNILTKRQQALKNSVVRRVDDPFYDPYEGKYINEESDDDEDHLEEGSHEHASFKPKRLENKSDQKDDDLEGLSASEIDLILRLRKDKQSLKAWVDKPVDKTETEYVRVETATPKVKASNKG